MASALEDILENPANEHKTAPDTESSVLDTEILREPHQISGSQRTDYSLLDMDFCGDSDLTLPLLDLPQGGAASSNTRTSSDLMQSAQESSHVLKIQEKIQSLAVEQSSHKEELKLALTGFSKDITKYYDEQVQQLKETMDKQFNYIRDQFSTTLTWRLKHHHTELLKEVKDVLSPMAQSVNHLQIEVWKCSQHLEGMVSDVSTMKNKSLHMSALADASVQTCPINDKITLPQRQHLQSTMHTGMTESPLSSPNNSPISGDLGHRFVGKCPLKLQFPTFGRMEDSPDPLLYLEKCKDFLSINPLSDEELMVTLRNVLYGTARDWWDVTRVSTHSWTDFQSNFLSAFLSEDYEDELAERVRTRVQGEDECIRDFAYMYRSLCCRWKPDITEEAVIKLILRNINPRMASQLRSKHSEGAG